MGNCGSHPSPYPIPPGTNNASIEIGQSITGDHFCTMSGPAGDKHRRDYCESVGGEVNGVYEWTAFEGDTCNYDDSDHVTNYGSGCCKGTCGIIGAGVKCTRQAYNAQPFVCCFNDSDGCGIADVDGKGRLDWQTSLQQYTCPPEYRDMTSSSCKDVVFDFCSGDVLLDGQENWWQAWTEGSSVSLNAFPLGGLNSDYDSKTVSQPCLKALMTNIYGNGNVNACDTSKVFDQPMLPGTVDPEGFRWGKRLVSAIFQKYIKDFGSPLGGLDADGIRNPSVDKLFTQICNYAPGLCRESIENMCSNITSEDLSRNPAAVQWCGCYMSDDQYSKYINQFQINKECTPFCNRTGNIPLVGDDDLSQIYCRESFCLIDNLVLELVDSIGESATFGQLCGSCTNSYINRTGGSDQQGASDEQQQGSGGQQQSAIQRVSNSARQGSTQIGIDRCQCVMSGTTLNIVNSKFENLNMTQNCGSAECYIDLEIGGEIRAVPVPCGAGTNQISGSNFTSQSIENDLSISLEQRKIEMNLLTMLIFVAIIVAVLFFILFLAGYILKRRRKFMNKL